MLDTNPVVAPNDGGLRKGGLVETGMGPRGGWRLIRSLDEITLLDVHNAFQPTSVSNIDLAAGASDCAVEEHAADAAVRLALDAATHTLEEALARYTLAEVRASAGF